MEGISDAEINNFVKSFMTTLKTKFPANRGAGAKVKYTVSTKGKTMIIVAVVVLIITVIVVASPYAPIPVPVVGAVKEVRSSSSGNICGKFHYNILHGSKVAYCNTTHISYNTHNTAPFRSW